MLLLNISLRSIDFCPLIFLSICPGLCIFHTRPLFCLHAFFFWLLNVSTLYLSPSEIKLNTKQTNHKISFQQWGRNRWEKHSQFQKYKDDDCNQEENTSWCDENCFCWKGERNRQCVFCLSKINSFSASTDLQKSLLCCRQTELIPPQCPHDWWMKEEKGWRRRKRACFRWGCLLWRVKRFAPGNHWNSRGYQLLSSSFVPQRLCTRDKIIKRMHQHL